jgi:hypothetical protein
VIVVYKQVVASDPVCHAINDLNVSYLLLSSSPPVAARRARLVSSCPSLPLTLVNAAESASSCDCSPDTSLLSPETAASKGPTADSYAAFFSACSASTSCSSSSGGGGHHGGEADKTTLKLLAAVKACIICQTSNATFQNPTGSCGDDA